MKSFLLIVMVAFLFVLPAGAQVSRDGVIATGGSPGTFSATGLGSLKIIFVYNNGSTTIPSLPGGWTSVATGATVAGGVTGAFRVGCNVSSSAADTASGTWTNASGLVGVSYSGTAVDTTANCATTGIGKTATNNAQVSATADFPAMSINPSGSWILALLGNNTSSSCTLAGLTSIAASGVAGAKDSSGVLASWSDETCALSGGSSTWMSFVLEVLQRPNLGGPNSFFTHFIGTMMDANFTAVTGGNGVICLNGTIVAGSGGTCAASSDSPSQIQAVSAVNGDSAAFYYKNKIDKTHSQMFLMMLKAEATGLSQGITFINNASTPAIDTSANVIAESRMRVTLATDSGTVVNIDKWDSSHTRTEWKTSTSTWVAPAAGSDAVTPASTDTFYLVGFELDSVNARWRINVWGVDGTGFSTFTQGMVQVAQTDWVTFASQETTANLWLVVGDLDNNTSVTDSRVEWAELADGGVTDDFSNGKNTTAGNYDIRHYVGYIGISGVPDIWTPETRTGTVITATSAWEGSDVKDAYVVQDGLIYYLLYDGVGTHIQIGVATCTLNCVGTPLVSGVWVKSPNNPILTAPGGNRTNIQFGSLIKDLTDSNANLRWKIVYSGLTSAATSVGRVYYATSPGPPDTGAWTDQGQIIDAGPTQMTISASPNGLSQANNTLTVTATNILVAGDDVYLNPSTDCSPNPVIGEWTVASATGSSFTINRTVADNVTCGGGGTADAADEGGTWQAQPVTKIGSTWYVFQAIKSNPTGNGTSEPGAPFRTTYSSGSSLTGLSKSHSILVDALGGVGSNYKTQCNMQLTANVTASRTLTVDKTAGCVADEYIVADQDTTTDNYLVNRILSVNSGTGITMYHRWDGLTTTLPARIRGVGAFPAVGAVTDYYNIPNTNTWYIYASCFFPFNDIKATVNAFNEKGCLFKSTTGIVGTYSIQQLQSPQVYANILGPMLRSTGENFAVVHQPIGFNGSLISGPSMFLGSGKVQ